jgi:hypothetical protein
MLKRMQQEPELAIQLKVCRLGCSFPRIMRLFFSSFHLKQMQSEQFLDGNNLIYVLVQLNRMLVIWKQLVLWLVY